MRSTKNNIYEENNITSGEKSKNQLPLNQAINEIRESSVVYSNNKLCSSFIRTYQRSVWEWNKNRIREETNNMPTILQINFQKMKPTLWEKIKFGNNEIVTIPFLIVCCIILLPARFEETCTLKLCRPQYSILFRLLLRSNNW